MHPGFPKTLILSVFPIKLYQTPKRSERKQPMTVNQRLQMVNFPVPGFNHSIMTSILLKFFKPRGFKETFICDLLLGGSQQIAQVRPGCMTSIPNVFCAFLVQFRVILKLGQISTNKLQTQHIITSFHHLIHVLN